MTTLVYSFVSMAATIFSALLLIRIYLRWLQTPYTDRMMGFAVRLTDWVVKPLSGFVSRTHKVEGPAIAAVVLVAFVLQAFGWLLGGMSVAPWWVLVGGVALALRWGLELAMWALVFYGLLSWFGRGTRIWPVYSFLVTPLFVPWKRIFPVVRGVDTAPAGLFLVLYLLVMALLPLTTKCLV